MTELRKVTSNSIQQNTRKISASQIKIQPSEPSQLQKSGTLQVPTRNLSHQNPFILRPIDHHSSNMNKHSSMFTSGGKPNKKAQHIWTNLTEIASNVSTAQLNGYAQNDELESPQKVSCLTKIQNIFIINGIVSMLYWNCLLSTFDYFGQTYQKFNVELYFPIPNFISAMITAMFFKAITARFSYKTLIIVSITMINTCLILLLVISLVTKSDPKIGFYCSVFLCLCLGFFGIIIQLSYCGMINYFNTRTVGNFNIGVGASGVFVTVLRMAITGIFMAVQKPSSSHINLTPVLIFLLVAVCFNFFGLGLNLLMFNKQIYKDRIVNLRLPPQQLDLSERNELQPQAQNQQSFSHENESYAKLLWGAFKTTRPYAMYIFFNGLFNFMLFPNLTLENKTSLSVTWSNLIYLLMFNGGTLMGKIIGGSRNLINKWITTYLAIGRLFFFFTIPIMDTNLGKTDFLLHNDYFPYVNQFLFALSSGILLNSSFILTFECVPEKYRKYAGVLNGTSYQFGVMVGTFMAVPMQLAIKAANK